MRRLRDLPISRKLTVIILLTSTLALLLACVSFVTYEQVNFRGDMVRDRAVTANLVGFNCVAALVFDDSASAAQTLLALGEDSHVVAACIYTPQGKVFASYRRPGMPAHPWPALQPDGDHFEPNRLNQFRAINSGSDAVGTIYLQSDLDELSARLRRYAVISAAVMIVTVLLSWLLSSRLQRVISEPVSQLAAIVDRVATAKDYSARAVKHSNDELGRLIDGFNHMLEQIEIREAELQVARDDLEQRVEQRTEALQQAQATATREQARFKLIFDSVPIGISYFSSNADGTLKVGLINEAHLQICGLTREETADPTVFKRISHPDDVVVQQALQARLDRLEIDHFSMEKRYLRMDGEMRWVVFSTQKKISPDGAREHLTTVVDITERKRTQLAQAALHQISEAAQSTKDLPTLLARVHEIIGGLLDAKNFYVALYDEPAGLLRFPYFADELDAMPGPQPLGHGLTALVLRTGKPLLLSAAMIETLQEKGEVQLAGAPPLDWLGIPLRAGERTFGVLAVQTYTGASRHTAKDQELLQFVSHQLSAVLERKAAAVAQEDLHRQLLDTSRQAGMAEVATGVLHNVGNVLNSVNVSSTLVSDQIRRSKVSNLGKVSALLDEHAADLGDYLTKDAKGKMIPAYLSSLAANLATEHRTVIVELENLRKNIEHIKEIVAMQQNYAKTSGVVESVSVVDLAEDAIRMNAGSLARHDVEIVRQYEAHPIITLEKNKVLQIIVNLVRNAKYACDEAGRVDKRISTRITADGNSVSIAIVDNGVGIPAENLTRIFAHGFTTRKAGHGFGLHSGANAAKELGGSLHAFSEGRGLGATFILKLPYKPETPLPT
ncbi:MAG: sensor signal transduction histidine kinase [Verrucomicrobia bacterium]|nr:sensor signal transduction histidine kinase [Verrucomicrobiota bacterium]